MKKIEKPDSQWREELTPEQYRIARQKGTEPPFSGQFVKHYEQGSYRCSACKHPLFLSEAKYDSGCGWPSFFVPASGESVETQPDTSQGLHRVEVTCSRCGAHIGHVFDDGPNPTGKRYCINSVSLDFVPDGTKKDSP